MARNSTTSSAENEEPHNQQHIHQLLCLRSHNVTPIEYPVSFLRLDAQGMEEA